MKMLAFRATGARGPIRHSANTSRDARRAAIPVNLCETRCCKTSMAVEASSENDALEWRRMHLKTMCLRCGSKYRLSARQ
jgi:hypothetical protein